MARAGTEGRTSLEGYGEVQVRPRYVGTRRESGWDASRDNESERARDCACRVFASPPAMHLEVERGPGPAVRRREARGAIRTNDFGKRETEIARESVNFGFSRSSPRSTIEELSREKSLATDFLLILSLSSRHRGDRERLSRPAARFRSVRNTNYEEGQTTEATK